MNLLGNRLKEIRKQNNMTQGALGKLVNVTKVSICCYEKGTRIPSLETLRDIASVFKVTIDYLLGNDLYIVADNDAKYSASLAKDEIEFIKELRTYPGLYDRLIADPKRSVQLINKKLK